MNTKPIVISCPAPRSLDLIFRPERREDLHRLYEVVETTDEEFADLPLSILHSARYIIGQPPLTDVLLANLKKLLCIFNVESNLLPNMPYDEAFRRGIYVVTTGSVFAMPVAEIGLGFALSLLRGIHTADADFRAGRERWGADGNGTARLLGGADVSIIGFGDLGQALARLLRGFRVKLTVHDPWLPASKIADAGARQVSLEQALKAEVVFVTAAVSTENQGFIDAAAFASMKPGAILILLSRADVVDFPALLAAVTSGHIMAATDVWPQEPLALDHAARGIPGLLMSAHRAGALAGAFACMGDMVLGDMDLMDRGLPPVLSRRAERETVARIRSRPVRVN